VDLGTVEDPGVYMSSIAEPVLTGQEACPIRVGLPAVGLVFEN